MCTVEQSLQSVVEVLKVETHQVSRNRDIFCLMLGYIRMQLDDAGVE